MNLALAKLKTFICFPLYQVKKVRVKTLVYWFRVIGAVLTLDSSVANESWNSSQGAVWMG